MKTPFTLEAWLEDKSQRVETRDGRIVHNIWPVKEPLIVNGKRAEVCVLIDGEENALVFFEGGKYLPVNSENPFDLFIVTPEEKLTTLEDRLSTYLKNDFEYFSTKKWDEKKWNETMRIQAAELLSLAKNQLQKEGLVTMDHLNIACEAEYQSGLAEGKAEALRTRATVLTENLAKSRLDKDSIPYHIIEFMCNLYTCQNWKEIEDTAELYVTRIKAAALKDLPRWIDNWDSLRPYKNISGLQYIVLNGKAMNVSDLEKLPKDE